MKNNKQFLFIISLLCFVTLSTIAQNQKVISGNVTNNKTGERIPFATISLKQKLVGTNSNENGVFEFHFPQEAANDSIVISCLGFATRTFFIENIQSPLEVKLEPFSFQLAEVVVRPLLPTDYLRMALRKVKENYPSKPFQSQAYYREQEFENNKIILQNEGIFQTYYPSYLDTVRNQHQLFLFRKADKQQLAFMHDKAERKHQKKINKAVKEGKDTSAIGSDFLNIGYGGPEAILHLDFIKDKKSFLDSMMFKKYNYSFGGSSTYEGKELMIITFEALTKIDDLKPKGKIYLDVESWAITNIEFNSEIEIPLLIRPIIFTMGYGADNLKVEGKIQYHEVDNKWYPKDFHWTFTGSLTKRHWFSANEHADLNISQLLFINKIETKNVTAIAVNKRFDSKKKFEIGRASCRERV